MNYVYSAEKNLFYPVQFQQQYENNGDWPSDATGVDDSVFHEFTAFQEGKIRVAGDNGLPEWADTPVPAYEQLVVLAEQQRNLFRANADSEIAWRQDAVEDGSATDEEAAALVEWKKYRVKLMRIDTSKAPDIAWPVQPTT